MGEAFPLCPSDSAKRKEENMAGCTAEAHSRFRSRGRYFAEEEVGRSRPARAHVRRNVPSLIMNFVSRSLSFSDT